MAERYESLCILGCLVSWILGSIRRINSVSTVARLNPNDGTSQVKRRCSSISRDDHLDVRLALPWNVVLRAC